MKRRGWIRFLSVLAAVMLPLSAMAQSAAVDLLTKAKTEGKEIVTTITFEPGKALTEEPAVADMSKVTKIRINQLSDGPAALTVVLNDVDVLSAQFKADDKGLFVMSEALGEKALYFGWEEITKAYADAMRESGMSEEEVARFAEGFTAGLGGSWAVGSAGIVDGKELTPEEIREQIVQSMDGDDSLIKWAEAIQEKAVVTAGEFVVRDSDTADTKTEIVITSEDFAEFIDLKYIRDQISEQVKADEPSLTEEQLAAKTDEIVEQAKKIYVESNLTAPVTVYTKGEDELVAMEMTMSGIFTPTEEEVVVATETAVLPETTADAEATEEVEAEAAVEPEAEKDEAAEPIAEPAPAPVQKPVKMDAAFVYTRQTLTDAAKHTMEMTMDMDAKREVAINAELVKNEKKADGTLTIADDSATLIVMNLTADYEDSKHVTGTLDVTALDEEVNGSFVLGFDHVVGDTTIDTALSVSLGESLEAIKADPETALQGTLKLNTVVQDDSGFLSAIGKVTSADAVEVLKLSAEEQQAFVASLESTAMKAFYKIIENLPSSVMNSGTTNTQGI